jgi:hypothetical protein
VRRSLGAALGQRELIHPLCHQKHSLLYVAQPGQSLPTEPGSIATPRYVDQPQDEWPHWANLMSARLCTGWAACLADVPVRIFLAHGSIGATFARFAADHLADAIVLVRQSLRFLHCGWSD